MPKRTDIRKILLVGSGPIVIGQAAEFDYSGVQACKVLLEEGYEVVLVNSNPATIMTDPEFATSTYIEPLLPGAPEGVEATMREAPGRRLLFVLNTREVPATVAGVPAGTPLVGDGTIAAGQLALPAYGCAVLSLPAG